MANPLPRCPKGTSWLATYAQCVTPKRARHLVRYAKKHGLGAPGCVETIKTIRPRRGKPVTFKTMVGDDCPKKAKPSTAHLRPYQYKARGPLSGPKRRRGKRRR